MRELRRIGVYCGSNFGTGDAYRAAASALGTELARRRIGLVYGGTHKGLMGVLADAVIAAGGETHGVITRRLADKGQLHAQLASHEIAPDMKSRKGRMIELADALVALPGGKANLFSVLDADQWHIESLVIATKTRAPLLPRASFPLARSVNGPFSALRACTTWNVLFESR